MNDIGEQIRKERLVNKLTLKNFAKMANIGTMTLQRIETGKTIPNVHVLIRIAQQLDRSIFDFLGKTEGFCKLLEKKDRKEIRQSGLDVSILSPKEMEQKGVSVSLLVEKKGTKLGPLKSEKRWVFVYHIKGEVTFEYRGRKYKVRRGDCLFFDGNCEHMVTINKNTEAILISIRQ